MTVQVNLSIQSYVTFSNIHKQSMGQTTHTRGHVLDWLLYREDDNILQSSSITIKLASDYRHSNCQLDVSVCYLVPAISCSNTDNFQIHWVQLTLDIKLHLADVNGFVADEKRSHLQSLLGTFNKILERKSWHMVHYYKLKTIKCIHRKAANVYAIFLIR